MAPLPAAPELLPQAPPDPSTNNKPSADAQASEIRLL